MNDKCQCCEDEKYQRLLRKLSKACGNPAIEFKAGHMEEALEDYFVSQLKRARLLDLYVVGADDRINVKHD